MSKYLYDNYVIDLANKFDKRLDDIRHEYNFDVGPEFEVAICEVLRSFLPQKYGICRGFVVTRFGEKAGDDIIIYDQERFPTLRINSKVDLSTKQFIPIEAVYAYIEAKHTLVFTKNEEEATFTKALKQVMNVKRVISTRDTVQLNSSDPYLLPLGHPNPVAWLPKIRNPTFCIILARHVAVDKASNKIEDPGEINRILFDLKIDRHVDVPDLVMFGRSNLIRGGIQLAGEKKPCLFFLNDPNSGYDVVKKTDLCFGIGLAQLFACVDWIRLGAMPWNAIIDDACLLNN